MSIFPLPLEPFLIICPAHFTSPIHSIVSLHQIYFSITPFYWIVTSSTLFCSSLPKLHYPHLTIPTSLSPPRYPTSQTPLHYPHLAIPAQLTPPRKLHFYISTSLSHLTTPPRHPPSLPDLAIPPHYPHFAISTLLPPLCYIHLATPSRKLHFYIPISLSPLTTPLRYPNLAIPTSLSSPRCPHLLSPTSLPQLTIPTSQSPPRYPTTLFLPRYTHFATPISLHPLRYTHFATPLSLPLFRQPYPTPGLPTPKNCAIGYNQGKRYAELKPVQRFYYDTDSNSCRLFTYGG